MSYFNLNVSEVREYCEDIFRRYGFSKEEAEGIVDVLLTADLYGVESHGIQRMIRYHDAITAGKIDINAGMEVLKETELSVSYDSHHMMGQLAARIAMRSAIDKAKAHGFGMSVVKNCNHFGIAGYYARMAADEDLIGFASTNTEAIAIPTYGRKAMLGTSPLAVCMPADPVYFYYDCATTVVPRGKLEVYNKRGVALPDGWAADENGNTCHDAQHALDNIIAKNYGGIFPIGGSDMLTGSHKGYGLGILMELFTAVLAGGHTSPHVEDGGDGDVSFGFMALDYGMLGDKTEIRKSMSRLLEDLRSSPKAEGRDRIYTHGEKEEESRREKLAAGIPVNEKTLGELKMIGSAVGLDMKNYPVLCTACSGN